MEAVRCRFLLGALAVLLAAGPVRAEPPHEEPLAAFEETPPRLAFTEGEVSFWRAGAEGWVPARPNLALASGDRLYAGAGANLELQIGPRAFVRAGDGSELGLESHEPDFLQFRIGSGTVSLDLRSLPPGHTVELDTPNAAFTIEDSGYYRLDVDDDATRLTCRRGGSATLTTTQGKPLVVGSSEQVIVEGEETPSAESYSAPELDDWDRWNYRRTDRQLDSLSARYVASDVYGASDLDQYGSWRTVEQYGPIWIPSAVPIGWAPYGFGRWVWDPRFGWTWLDDAPWGWAPFHYGRWIFVTGHWAWVPGPIVRRAYYAPALVAFFGSPHSGIGFSFGAPAVAWVPLGWGEPCVPWWGPRGFAGEPHWLGWGGPRVVNQVVIQRKVVVHADGIHEWENARQPGGFVAVNGKSFGRKPVEHERLAGVAPDKLVLLHGSPPIERAAESFSGSPDKVRPPPKQTLERRVVATRRAVEPTVVQSAPEPKLVQPPHGDAGQRKSFKRTPFGSAPGEERAVPEPPPRFESVERGGAPKLREPKLSHTQQPTVSHDQEPTLPKPAPVYVPPPHSPQLELPGEPANRVYRGRSVGGGEHRGRDVNAPRSPTPSSDPAGLLPGAPPLRSR